MNLLATLGISAPAVLTEPRNLALLLLFLGITGLMVYYANRRQR